MQSRNSLYAFDRSHSELTKTVEYLVLRPIVPDLSPP